MGKARRPLLARAQLVAWFHSFGRACLRDKRAASAAEYALVLAIIGAAIALTAITIGGAIGNKMDAATKEIAEGTTVELPADIRRGQAAFIKPDEMKIGGWYPVEFVAGPTIEALRVESEELPLTKPRPIYVGESMLVRLLKDPNFEIKAKSPALQQTGPDMAATWQWDVKPAARGTRTLIAQVDVLKRRPDGRYDLFNRFSRRVSVRVTVGKVEGVLEGIRNAESIGEALTALFRSLKATLISLGALVAAAFGVRWGFRKFRRRAPRPDELEASSDSDGEGTPYEPPPESPR